MPKTHPTQTQALIVGKSSFLGSTLTEQLSTDNLAINSIGRDSIDLAKPIPSSFQKLLDAGRFQYVVICAAITDVETCFRERDLSRQVNVDGTLALLECIRNSGATPVFFSSDYTFKPATTSRHEDDLRRPETVYGCQKLAVEQYIQSNFDRFLILRTSKLMSITAHPKNILLPIIRSLRESKPIRLFEDQWLNPVFVEDVAKVLELSFARRLNGTFHLGTRRVFTRLELGVFLAQSLGYDPALVQPIRMAELFFSEKRPTHNTLHCGKIETALDFRFLEIEDSIQTLRHLAELS